MSKLQEAKSEYNHYCEYYPMLIHEEASDYVEELENSNAEMLKFYIKLYKWCQTTELDISLVMMTDIGNIIEKETGKKIEDVIK